MRTNTVLSAFVVLLVLGSSAAADTVIAGVTVVGPSAHDFGTVAVGDEDTYTVTIRNDSTESRWVTVTPEGRRDGAFPQVSSRERARLQPGQFMAYRIRFAPQLAGAHSTSVGVEVSRDNFDSTLLGSTGLAFKGVSTGGSITIDPIEYDYGDVLVKTEVVKQFKITNASGAGVTLKKIEAGRKPFKVTRIINGLLQGVKVPHTLAPGASIDVFVRFKPKKVGTYEYRLKIRSKDGFPDTKAAIPLMGRGIEKLGLSEPSRLDFGMVPSNVFHTRTLMLCNYTDGTLTGSVNASKFDPEFWTVTGAGPFSLGPREEKPITIRFGSISDCVHKSKLTIRSDGLRSGKAKVKVVVDAFHE